MALLDQGHRLQHWLAALGAGLADRSQRHIVLTAPTAADFEDVAREAARDPSARGAVVYDMGPMLTLYFDDDLGRTFELNWYKPPAG